MASIHTLLAQTYQRAIPWAQQCYRQPLLLGLVLSVLTDCYLISDYGVVNRSALDILWQLQTHTTSGDPFATLISIVSRLFGVSAVTAGHALMVFCHAMIMALLLLLAKQLYFSKLSRWALIFLLLFHPSYADFRAYIIVEPLFWVVWLLAIYCLLRFYRKKTVLAIGIWFVLFLLMTQFTVVAWFWLLLFPFGTLFWKPWRRKSVAYALLGYAAIVALLLFLPVYQGDKPISWFVETVVNNPNSLAEVLGLNQSNWVKEENSFMAGVFVFSGATSLVLIRSAITFGVACLGLSIYALLRRQYRIAHGEYVRILAYVLGFDWFISVALLVLNKDSGSIISFSTSFLLFLLAALGLSYIFKKMANGRYSRLITLVIVWCLVAYFASGMIIFGPRRDYLREAGEYTQQINDLPVYSNDELVLFYAGKDPSSTRLWNSFYLLGVSDYYFAYKKGRHEQLPDNLRDKMAIVSFANPRGDKVLVYRVSGQ